MTTESDHPEPPPASVSIIVLTLAHRVEAELGAALTPLQLTVSRLALLGHIASVPGASFSDLARMGAISVQSVHTAVKAMVAAGLVRDRTARAGSASIIELTAKGKRLLSSAQEVVAEVDERLFGPAADPFQRRVGVAVLSAFAARNVS
ncbi:MarR family winged helix-turn-helix transcriptional regulator [Nocardia sp. NBC_01503]|uniref:MarR family winged helix-turn-helix transcriptional regulator n=1 Tax=Nocardia sp. NBC_01503 TaxID=2975997 RepID=UPI002E7BA8E5|nr:MarR family winged helix-turn-helix transcriptional regulator [Nocardia sp. NBC_01503]WTL30467.1 MarR family winged helix-turn-helix transcriptional regulator [Nocardia sp. NBC_01503]